MLDFRERFAEMAIFSRIIYSLFYTLAACTYGPYYLLRNRGRRQARIPWLERLGRVPARLSHPGDREALWIHAVSVGETTLLRPLVSALAGDRRRLFISTTTETGQALARELFGKQAEIFYFPLDFAWSCGRYLDRIRPRQVLIMETEIWPNFIHQAARRGISVSILNGRISDRSLRRYLGVRRLLAPFLAEVHRFCMQSREDKNRILEMGAPAEKVHQVGNLKFDYDLPPAPAKEELASRIGNWLGESGAVPIWLCGSTREQEEELLLGVFDRLRRSFPRLRLILVPRHPHRAASILAEASAIGATALLRSRLEPGFAARNPPDVLIIDSIGELAYLYSIADVVFVGGSLFPSGGHNVIEAAHFSKPILFGPHMQNFRDIASHFLASYAALQVQSADELVPKIAGLLEDPAARRWLGRNARKVVRDNHGALQRTLEILEFR